MNQIISLALVALGLVVLFAPEYILQKDNSNYISTKIHDYHQFIGVGLLACSYYIYSTSEKPIKNELPSTVDSSETPSSSPKQELPTYDEATSE
jgi:hypothetical protein